MTDDIEHAMFELIGGPLDGEEVELPYDSLSFIGMVGHRFAAYMRKDVRTRFDYLQTDRDIWDAITAIEQYHDHH